MVGIPSGISDYGAATWLSALFGVADIPTGYFLALCADQPGAAQDGDMLAALEPDDSAYARQPYGTGETAWGVNGNYLTNLLGIAFPVPGEDWGYLNHFALTTDATAGQVYGWGELLTPQFVTTGIGMLIPAGALVLGLHALESSIVA